MSDLAEEHSTAQLAGERLEAEQADRMRLQKDLDSAQVGSYLPPQHESHDTLWNH